MGAELCRPDHLALRLPHAWPGTQAGTGEDSGVKGDCLCRSSRRHSVKVSLDNAQTWHEPRIDYKGAPMAWVLWSYDWQPTQPEEYTLVVRATDGTGELQTPDYRSFALEGATGYHVISVRVDG